MMRVAVVVLSILSSGVAFAEDSQPEKTIAGADAFKALFGQFGASYTVEKSPCRVTMDLKQSKFIENFDKAQKLGLMNDEITQAKINKQPNTLTMGMIIQLMPVVTRSVYEDNGDVDRCSFTQYVTAVDDYGNDKRELAVSYNFTKAIAAKINWDQFPNQNMIKVAPNFHFTPAIMMKVSAENNE